MPISFECPACQKRLSVSRKFCGKSGACPKCQATIDIPKADQATGGPSVDESTEAPRAPSSVTAKPEEVKISAVASDPEIPVASVAAAAPKEPEGEDLPKLLPDDEDSSDPIEPSPVKAPPVKDATAQAVVAQAPVQAKSAAPAATGRDLKVGDVISERYAIKSVLGRGGMGVVYDVEDELTKSTIALKVMRPELSASEDMRQRFVKELTVVRQLRHANIVQVFDVGYDKPRGLLYYTMERLQGRPLRERMKQSPKGMFFDEAKTLFSQLLLGVIHSHEQKIVHRDLKPENVLLAQGSTVKILDFGLLKVLEDNKPLTQLVASLATQPGAQSHQVMGTFHYCAPEQQESAANCDERSDVYSLGVILYELLTGKKPVGVFEKVSEQRTDVPKDVDAVVEKALKNNPDQRYQSARDLLIAIQGLSTSDLLQFKDEVNTPTPSRPVRAVAAKAAGIQAAGRPQDPITPQAQDLINESLSRNLLTIGGMVALVGLLVLGQLFLSRPYKDPAGFQFQARFEPYRAFTNKGLVTFQGKLNKGGAKVVAGDEETFADEDGAFEIEVPLEKGKQVVNFEFRTEHGHKADHSFQIVCDKTRPKIELEKKVYVDKGNGVFVKGRILEDHLDGLWFDSTKVANAATTRFQVLVYASAPKIQITARDKAGNESKTFVTIKQDFEDEHFRSNLTLKKLPTEFWVPGGKATLKGKINRSNANVLMGKLRATTDTNGRFELEFDVLDGQNIFPLSVQYAKSEKQLPTKLTVTRDDQIPELTIQGLDKNRLIKLAANVDSIQGVCKDDNLRLLLCNGEPVSVNAKGGFKLDIDPEQESPLILTIEAEDKAGNRNLQRATVLTAQCLEELKSFAGRARDLGRERQIALRKHGGSKDTEMAVERALDWLIRHQDRSGAWHCSDWSSRCQHQGCQGSGTGAGNSRLSVATTSLATLALLGHGLDYAHNPRRTAIDRAIAWLLKQQEPAGSIGYRGRETMYNHAIATLAVCEYVALSDDDEAREAAEMAVKFCIQSQTPGYGWSYQVKMGTTDTAVTCWMVLALRAAEAADIVVPDACLKGALQWFQLVTNGNGFVAHQQPPVGQNNLPPEKGQFAEVPSGVAVALLGRLTLNDNKREPRIQRSCELISASMPYWQPGAKPVRANFYYWFHATYALFELSKKHWESWNSALKKALLPRQRPTGCAAGSWDPVGEWCVPGGRVMATALNALTLQVYHRAEAPHRVRLRRSKDATGPSPSTLPDKPERAVKKRVLNWLSARKKMHCSSCKTLRYKVCVRCKGQGQVKGYGVNAGYKDCKSCSRQGHLLCSHCHKRNDGLSRSRVEKIIKRYGQTGWALKSYQKGSLTVESVRGNSGEVMVSCKVTVRVAGTKRTYSYVEKSIWWYPDDKEKVWKARSVTNPPWDSIQGMVPRSIPPGPIR